MATEFERCASLVSVDRSLALLPLDDRLKLYGLYKVSTEGGSPPAESPSVFDRIGRRKHAAWSGAFESVGGSQATARRHYIALARDLGVGKEASPALVPAAPAPTLAPAAAAAEEKADLQGLLEEIAALRQRLVHAGVDPNIGEGSLSGYLYRYKPSKLGVMGLGPRGKWVLRFFVIRGGSLKCYMRAEQQGHIETWRLKNCDVDYEGPKKDGRFFAISVRRLDAENIIGDERGGLLLRFSATKAEEALRWLEALRSAISVAEDEGEDETSGAGKSVGALGLAAMEVPDDGESDRSAEGPSRVAALEAELQASVAAAAASPTLPLPPPSPSPRRTSKGRASGTRAKRFDPRMYPASKPIHRQSRPSPLSADAEEQNFRGFMNLGGLLLVVVNFRMIVENLKKYGLRLRLPSAEDSFRDWPCLSGALLLSLNVVLAYAVERAAASGRASEGLVALIAGVNMTAVLALPTMVIWGAFGELHTTPPAALCYVFLATVLFLKLVSYHHVLADCRAAQREGGAEMELRVEQYEKVRGHERPHRYPVNVSLANAVYFWFAPTLSYQLSFPRSERVRKRYVVSLALRLLACVGLMIFLTEQYIIPGVQSSVPVLREGSPVLIAERVLRLSVPTTYVWLLGFYASFHLGFCLIAELLRFGDRMFFSDWWNAGSWESYWQKWNLPVHAWMVRHVYFPARRLGLSKPMAIFLVFFISAVFHEFLFSVPFKTLRPWAFLGMMAQIPLVIASKSVERFFENRNVGNLLFWISFCVVGQPLAVLLYAYDLAVQGSEGAGGAGGGPGAALAGAAVGGAGDEL